MFETRRLVNLFLILRTCKMEFFGAINSDMEELIRKEDFIKAANLKKYKIARLADVLMKTLKLEQVNKVYQDSFSENSLLFIDQVLGKLEVQYTIRPEDLENLPKEGAFVTVSNHPYGGIDGLILLRIVSEHRPDYRLMANFLLQKIQPLREHFLAVNPFDKDQVTTSSLSGMKVALTHLREGHPVGIFPAGEVSTLQRKNVTDKQWSKPALKLVKHAKVPIVPIYFRGGNSALFHLLGLINPILRTAKLPSELLNKKNRVIEVRIGKPISVDEQRQFEDLERFGRYVRSKTYALGSSLEVKRFFRNSLRRKSKAEAIQAPQPIEVMAKEITFLERDHLLFESSGYKVFCAPSQLIPATLQEIGRLREITYREVGEGTNHACDLDEFDLYYQHLIIWDTKEQAIVGGYRIGKGADIMRGFGIRGFYVFQLFKIRRKFFPVLKESLELGRSYVVQAYQRKPLPLFLLWKGILVFLLKNPEYRYLIGPVSISSRFSGFSKGILIEFLKRHYNHEKFSSFIKPRNAFKPHDKDLDVDILLESSQKDLAKLDKLIQEIDPLHLNIPVLFKKYIKQNAKVIGFNLDPKFNDALDGLMLLDIYDVPAATIQSLMKEMNNPELNEAMKKRNLT